MSTKALERGDSRLGIVSGAPIEFDLDALRPHTRGECMGATRPCPWIGCRHHLFLDVSPETGSIKLNRPDVELADLAETCVLDVADRGPLTLEATGIVLNLTRERCRQIELVGEQAMRALAVTAELH